MLPSQFPTHAAKAETPPAPLLISSPTRRAYYNKEQTEWELKVGLLEPSETAEPMIIFWR